MQQYYVRVYPLTHAFTPINYTLDFLLIFKLIFILHIMFSTQVKVLRVIDLIKVDQNGLGILRAYITTLSTYPFTL